MKKLVSICMAVVMCIMSVNVVFANESEKETFNPVILGSTEILDVEFLDNGEKVYTAMYGDVQNIVTEKEISDGKLYTFKQDNLENELVIKKDGKMYLDGNAVTVTINSSTTQESRNSNPVARAYYEYWDISETKFASGSYTYNKKVYDYNLELDKKFSQVAIGAVAGVIVGALFVNPLTGATVALATYNGLGEFYSWMKAANPNQNTMYVRKTTWTNNAPDTSGNPLEYYYKVKTEYSNEEDYSDLEYTDTFYAVQYINNH